MAWSVLAHGRTFEVSKIEAAGCRSAASGQATAALPRSAMKLRRLSRIAHRGQSLPKGSVVHHSKNCAMMSQMGLFRQIDVAARLIACPLRAKSRQAGKRLAKSALCQEGH
jgi:hypothetical protein